MIIIGHGSVGSCDEFFSIEFSRSSYCFKLMMYFLEYSLIF